DDRFTIAAVRLAYTGLTGQKALEVPTDTSDPDFDGKMKAFRIQSTMLQSIAGDFKNDSYNFKTALKGIVDSKLFRASNAFAAPSPGRETELYELGTASLATPENLAKKIRAVTGFPWGNNGQTETQRRDVSYDTLLDFAGYRLLFGGIDSLDTVQRLRTPN